MEGSSLPQSTTPDGHSHPPRPYDPNVGSSSTSAPPQTTPEADHSMDWQDVSFMSNEADEVIPEDEDDASYKRRKARERQRRKRLRDRANGIGRNGQPATPRRYPGADVGQFEGSNPFADPPPDPAALAAMTPEEARKEKMRRAARERQRKHRAVVRARRAEDEAEADAHAQAHAVAAAASGSANGANAPLPEGAIPVNPPDSVGDGHIEQEVNPGEPHPVSYEQQQPTFAYYAPPMWPPNPFAPGQFFHPHPHHPGPFVQNGQMMPPHMVPMLPPHQQQPPQTMNPMQMQVSPAPPSPRPADAPAPTPSPAPAAPSAPAPSPPQSAPAPAPSVPTPAPPATPTSTAAPTPATPAQAPAPAPAPTTPSVPIQLASLVSVAPALPQPPPPSHTPGQQFAMILSLALNSNQSQLLRAHIMQQHRLTQMDLTELEGVIARAFDVWDRERGEDSSNQLQQAMQVPGALPVVHHLPPPQPQPAQPQAQPPPQPQPPQEPATPQQPTHVAPQQSPTQSRTHPVPVTPQSQPRLPRASTTRRALGVGQPHPSLQPQPQQGGTLNVPRPIAGRSVSVGGVAVRALGPTSTPTTAEQRSVSQPQRHPHAQSGPPPSIHQQRSVSVVSGQKRPAPGSQPQPPPQQQQQAPPGQSRATHALQQSMHSPHSVPVPVQSRPQTQPPQPRSAPPQQQQSRPGSQPQTPVMGPTGGGNGAGASKGTNGGGGGILPANTVLGHGPGTLA